MPLSLDLTTQCYFKDSLVRRFTVRRRILYNYGSQITLKKATNHSKQTNKHNNKKIHHSLRHKPRINKNIRVIPQTLKNKRENYNNPSNSTTHQGAEKKQQHFARSHKREGSNPSPDPAGREGRRKRSRRGKEKEEDENSRRGRQLEEDENEDNKIKEN